MPTKSSTKSEPKPKRNRRMELLGWLASYVGGWNASAGSHPGRLVFDVDIEDDEQVAQRILAAHKGNIEKPLQREIASLKSEIYDLRREIANLEQKMDRQNLKLCAYQVGKMPADYQYPTPTNPFPGNGHTAGVQTTDHARQLTELRDIASPKPKKK